MKKVLAISAFVALTALLIGGTGPASQASDKHTEGNYRGALELYKLALEKYPDQTWPIKYNMAQCYRALDSSNLAIRNYQHARSKLDAELNSLAHNNEGVLHTKGETRKLALEQFKEALKANPENEEARYNYELYVKRYNNQNNEPPPPENEDSDSLNPGISDPQNQPPPPPKLENGPVDNSDDPEISIDQAKSILRGMAGKEKRFIQELKKYPRQKSPRDGSPNW